MTQPNTLNFDDFLYLQEMQQVAPPLTGIHTPNKGGNSVFAFGHRNVTQENAVLPSFPSKGKLSGMITINKVQTFNVKF